MKRLFLFVLISSVVLFSACSGRALKFNNQVVTLQKELEAKVTIVTEKIERADSVQMRALVPEMKTVVAYIDQKTTELKALQAPEDGAAFKKSMVEQFELIKKIYKQNIRFFEDKLSDDERIQLAADMQTLIPEAKRLEEETIKAQQIFAKKNNITLR